MKSCLFSHAVVALVAAVSSMPASGQSPEPSKERLAIDAMFAAARTGNLQTIETTTTAVVALGKSVAPLVVADLGKRQPAECIAALHCVVALDGVESLDSILPLATHADTEVRASAVAAIAALGATASADVLWKAAGDPAATVRRRAFDGIVEHLVTNPRAVPIAIDGITDTDFWVAMKAQEILSAQPVPAPPAQDAVAIGLLGILGRANEQTIRPMLEILQTRGRPAITAALRKAVAHPLPAVTVAAFESAAQLQIHEVIDAARDAAKARNVAAAAAAITYIGAVHDDPSLPLLVDVLEQFTEKERREAAAVALRQCTSQLFGYDASAWRSYLNPKKSDPARRKRGG